MPNEGIIVGFYFAEDYIIHCSKPISGHKYTKPNRTIPAPKESGRKNIRLAAKIIQETYTETPILGIGMAVPSNIIVLDKSHPDYGCIKAPFAPKGWKNINVVQELILELGKLGVTIPKHEKIGVVSHVGATALGDYELRLRTNHPNEDDWRKAQWSGNALYIIADSGIGCALINKGRLFHGLTVPNIGHSIIHLHEERPPKECEFHGKRPCLNSVASLNAIKSRWGKQTTVTENGWECDDAAKVSLVANYIAQAVSNLIYFSSPKEVVIGGRIEKNPFFLDLFRENLSMVLGVNRDINHDGYEELINMSTFVRGQTEFNRNRPEEGLDLHAGVRGAIELIDQWNRKFSSIRSKG